MWNPNHESKPEQGQPQMEKNVNESKTKVTRRKALAVIGAAGALMFSDRLIPGTGTIAYAKKKNDISAFDIDHSIPVWNITSLGASVSNTASANTPFVTQAIENSSTTSRAAYIPAGAYPVNPVSLGSGAKLIGDGQQNYGEFQNVNASVLSFASGPDTACLTVPSRAFPIHLSKLSIEGSWNETGLALGKGTREIELDNVSIKAVANGLVTDDNYFSRWNLFTVTCQNTGILLGGGGTTIVGTNVIVQGDKVNQVRAKVGIDISSDLATVHLSAFAAQYVERCVTIGSSAEVVLDAANFEDFTVAAISLKDTWKSIVDIRGSLGAMPEGSALFEFDGQIGSMTRIYLRSLKVYDHWVYGELGNRAFAKLGPNFTSFTGKIFMDEELFKLFAKHPDAIPPEIMPHINIIRDVSANNGDCLYLKGATTYRIPTARLQGLYEAKAMYDPLNDKLLLNSSSAAFGNGALYKAFTNDISAPHFAHVVYFSVRSASPRGFGKTPIVGDINISYDTTANELIVQSATANQEIYITTA